MKRFILLALFPLLLFLPSPASASCGVACSPEVTSWQASRSCFSQRSSTCTLWLRTRQARSLEVGTSAGMMQARLSSSSPRVQKWQLVFRKNSTPTQRTLASRLEMGQPVNSLARSKYEQSARTLLFR